MTDAPALRKSLGTLHLWGLAVGLVISGEYFGWSYGWASAGTLGFLLTTALVAVFYLTFIFSFTELATAIPDAGGPFSFARRAFGPTLGFIAGFACLVEFVFAPPAIALSIGAYLNVQFPGLSPGWTACACYFVFMGLNIRGVHVAAAFELFVTLLAIFELCVFIGLMAPSFSLAAFTARGWAGAEHFSSAAWPGIFGAIPFAIWFFLAIEGAALAAEETQEPERAVPRAFSLGILTLVVLAFGVMLSAGGTGDWTSLANRNDPLPEAMKRVVGESSGWLHMLVWIGLFGLIASFHGIILGYSRQIFAMARAGFLPRALAELHPRYATPHRATWLGGAIGLVALALDPLVSFAGEALTARLVTLSVLGALTLYILSLLSLFRLRKTEPTLVRPFRAPFYPVVPLVALLFAILFIAIVIWTHPVTSSIFIALITIATAVFVHQHRRAHPKAPGGD